MLGTGCFALELDRSHLNTSLPLQTSLQHAARDCFTALEHRIASLVGGLVAMREGSDSSF